MIVAERKPLAEIFGLIKPHAKVLVLGCGGCVTVCSSGGKKEVGVLTSALTLMARRENLDLEIVEETIERQCDREFMDPIRGLVNECDAVLSTACGAGVGYMAELHMDKPVYPALNTTFIGVALGHGKWSERCKSCGNCVLGLTGGICPISRCAKLLFNGPCGGSTGGKCEISREHDCAWQLVYDRLKALGNLEAYMEMLPPKDWSDDKDGGPRIYIREDLAV